MKRGVDIDARYRLDREKSMFIQETQGYALRQNSWVSRGTALVLIAYCAPLMALVAVAVRLEDQGPVFMRSRASGGGYWQFRTTTVRETNGSVDGDRIFVEGDASYLGRFLQKSRLEKLPQLWNVATGELSITAVLR